MSKKYILALIIACIVAAILLVQPASTQTEYQLVWEDDCSGRLEIEAGHVECYELVESTPTPTPEPTATDEPAPTNTPTPTPEPTATPAGNGQPDPDDPPCIEHDDRQWHPLHNATQDCHYDHAHGQPLQQWAYDLFGPEAVQLGQVVSYPWQTERENELKHQGYIMHSRDIREHGCHPNARGSDGSVNAFAFQFHGVGISHGKLARVHSFYTGLNLCTDAGDAGQIIAGGYADYGQLVSPYKKNFVSYPKFPEQKYHVGLPPYIGEPDPERSDTRQETWNSINRRDSRPHVDEHQLVSFAFRIQDVMDYVDPDTRLTGDPVFIPFNEPVNNSSSYQLYQIEVGIPDLNRDGSRVDFVGYTDVHGNISETCEASSNNCVPLTIRNAIPGSYSVNITNGELADLLGIDTFSEGFFDHDEYFQGEPSGWIDLSGFGEE